MSQGGIGSALKGMLKSLGLYEGYQKHRTAILWEKVCGKKVAEITVAESLKGQTLFVAVKDHIWASELSAMQIKYLEKFRKMVGDGVVTRIFFKAKPALFRKKKNKQTDEPAQWDFSSVELAPKDLELISRNLQGLSGENRELHERFMINAMKRRKMLLQEGGHVCPACNAVVPADMKYCPPCQKALDGLNRGKVRELMREKPWISFDEALEVIDSLTFDTYSVVCQGERKRLEQEVETLIQADRGGKDNLENARSKIIILALMNSKVPPARLSDEIIRNSISPGFFDILKKPGG